VLRGGASSRGFLGGAERGRVRGRGKGNIITRREVALGGVGSVEKKTFGAASGIGLFGTNALNSNVPLRWGQELPGGLRLSNASTRGRKRPWKNGRTSGPVVCGGEGEDETSFHGPGLGRDESGGIWKRGFCVNFLESTEGSWPRLLEKFRSRQNPGAGAQPTPPAQSAEWGNWGGTGSSSTAGPTGNENSRALMEARAARNLALKDLVRFGDS